MGGSRQQWLHTHVVWLVCRCSLGLQLLLRIKSWANRQNQPVVMGHLFWQNPGQNPGFQGILLVEWWDRIELVCWTRLPGRATGTVCGQLYIVTSHILVFVLTGYIFVVLRRNFWINSQVLYNLVLLVDNCWVLWQRLQVQGAGGLGAHTSISTSLTLCCKTWEFYRRSYLSITKDDSIDSL